jgi:Domain of unknown function (DUF4416)
MAAHPKAGKPGTGAPVKLIAAILSGRGFDAGELLFPQLEERFGRIDHSGETHSFAGTDYYEDEMGPGLSRMIISFEPLAAAPDIVQAKLDTAAIEESLSEGGGRRVNIDPGYMDYYKIVLASFKEGPQKIFLGRGVYADPILLFYEGEYVPFQWTFPDFKAGIYAEDFRSIRALYKKARRGEGIDS